jgi:tetratricopeptide (TPR) repeat protein
VPVRFCRFASVVAIAALFTLAVAWGQAPEKKWKDGNAEYELYSQALKQTDNTKKLELLNAWKAKYPTSDYSFDRLQHFLNTYQALKQPDKVLESGSEILAVDPKNLAALLAMTTAFQTVPNPTPGQFALGDKAAKALTSDVDALKPAAMADAEWTKSKAQLETLGHATLAWSAVKQKQNDVAEKEYGILLKADSNNGQVAYALATAIIAQRNPDKVAEGLYYFARAAYYTGPGAMDAAGRKTAGDYLTKQYTAIHGSTEGLDELRKTAAAQPFPPAGFKITSKAEIDALDEAAREKSNPMLALWTRMKDALTAANGQQYFDSGVKGALLPGTVVPGVTKFKGKLVSLKPVKGPKELVLSISDAVNGDVLIVLDEALPGTAPVGTELSFEGVPSAFTASPFRITFEVERLNIGGWPSKIPPPTPKAAPGAATPATPAAGTKKAAPPAKKK